MFVSKCCVYQQVKNGELDINNVEMVVKFCCLSEALETDGRCDLQRSRQESQVGSFVNIAYFKRGSFLANLKGKVYRVTQTSAQQ